jgi:hypothetical protein
MAVLKNVLEEAKISAAKWSAKLPESERELYVRFLLLGCDQTEDPDFCGMDNLP